MTKPLLTALILLFVATPLSAQNAVAPDSAHEPGKFHALLLTLALSRGADASLTHTFLNLGAHEDMLPTQNPWIADALIGTGALGEQAIYRRLHRPHPRVAVVAVMVQIAVNGYLVQRNIRVIHEQLGFNHHRVP